MAAPRPPRNQRLVAAVPAAFKAEVERRAAEADLSVAQTVRLALAAMLAAPHDPRALVGRTPERQP